LVAAFTERLPKTLLEQLAPTGRLIVPLGSTDSQHLVLLTKDKNGEIDRRILIGCRFVPLIEGENPL
jgi:protein-L-isoaspartate(D-aspartate) O-methyltransferase